MSIASAPDSKWADLPTITSIEELESYGLPEPATRDKVLDRLQPIHVRWIEACPLAFVGTATPDGRVDVSPKGDPAGFIKVLDATTLAIPERPGNRRMDGFHNMLTNPHIGLELVIPGRPDTLRINGQARIVTDGPFFDDLIVKGHRPQLATLVLIEEVFYHCPKAFLRSQTWKQQTWQPDIVPSYVECAKTLWRAGDDPAQVDAHYAKDAYRRQLYAGK